MRGPAPLHWVWRLEANKSAADTTAPLFTVPFIEDGPGIVPSMPTTMPPLVLADRRPCTRNRFMVFPGCCPEMVNIWLSSSQGPVEFAETFVPKRARSAAL